MQQAITDAVDRSITALVDLFQGEPSRFFTENDLVCCFHRMLHGELSGLGLDTVLDKDGLPHGLIHCEYPTPFRCDMGGKRFQIKTDEDRTPGGRRFKRGHFDVVTLNPEFIRRHSYAAIKGQNYALLRSAVLPSLDTAEPLALYGVEFVFCRDEIKPSRGKDWQKAARGFVETVRQDWAKLAASLAVTGFMRRAVMLAFLKGTSGSVLDSIRSGLQGLSGVRLTTA